jgi:quinoprotein relay system zinc metallohydrolase 1
MRHVAATALVLVVALGAAAALAAKQSYQYALEAHQIAPDTWVVEGERRHFRMANGGHISNLGFIVTSVGVVVIDTGSSLEHGRTLRRLIDATSGNRPIVRVFNTHQHPDHVLGNAAFGDVPIEALPGTIDALRTDGSAVLDNVYRLLGPWMRGTELHLPTVPASPRELQVGNHTLQVLALDGHTAADLVLHDKTTGVLFCGDLCFSERAPTTPNADISRWLVALQSVSDAGASLIVPGHGPVIREGDDALALNAAYLEWLDNTISAGVEAGADMPELMQKPIPTEFSRYAILDEEYPRSVMHLFPRYEAALFGTSEELSQR